MSEHGDADERQDPLAVRAELVKELEDLQKRMAGLMKVRDRAVRNGRMEELNKQSCDLREDIDQIDRIIALTPPSVVNKSSKQTSSRSPSPPRVVMALKERIKTYDIRGHYDFLQIYPFFGARLVRIRIHL